jgi:glycolate oxidase
VLLSMERFNAIVQFDEKNQQITVESGVITQHIMDLVESKNLYYPIDPSSKGSCFIGGNIAHGSGGPRVVKYGTIRDYVLNLEVVLADGSVIWTATNTLKFASGYNLTQYFIGAEGTLGIVTKAVLKLIPKPKQTLIGLVDFAEVEQACAAVSALFGAGLQVSAIEYMDIQAIAWVVQKEEIPFQYNHNAAAYLLVEFDGNMEEVLMQQMEEAYEVFSNLGAGDFKVAQSNNEKEQFWKIRRNMALAVKRESAYRELDTVVPRAQLPQLISGIKRIEQRDGFKAIVYGHAGDGNLHVNVLKQDLDEQAWKQVEQEGLKDILALAVELGGAISGEHGVGYVQKSYLRLMYSDVHFELFTAIKKVFDPKGILNPGKIF